MLTEKWNRFLLPAVNGVLLVCVLFLSWIAASKVRGLSSQQMADRWAAEDIPYAQVSAFLAPQQYVQADRISEVRSSLMGTLSKDAYDVRKETPRLWIDGYSGECSVSVQRENKTQEVTAVGVGGDFFQFHPMQFLSGSGISEQDMNRDRIVVDRGFAWNMFGSNDIVGMQVKVNETYYTIVGVVAVEEERIPEIAYGDGCRIYMLYDELAKQAPELTITCYEAVLPNPISNYAVNAVKKAFGLSEEEEDSVKKHNPVNREDLEILENTGRFHFLSLLSGIRNRKYLSMRANHIAYPFWENVARVAEERQRDLLLWRMILLIIPCLSLVWWLKSLWKRRTWTAKSLVTGLFENIRERSAQKAWQKRMEKEQAEDGENAEEDGLLEEDDLMEEDDMSEENEPEEDGLLDEDELVEADDTEEDEPEDLKDIEDDGDGWETAKEEEESTGILYSVTGEDIFSRQG